MGGIPDESPNLAVSLCFSAEMGYNNSPVTHSCDVFYQNVENSNPDSACPLRKSHHSPERFSKTSFVSGHDVSGICCRIIWNQKMLRYPERKHKESHEVLERGIAGTFDSEVRKKLKTLDIIKSG
jgi:hypothetical protein